MNDRECLRTPTNVWRSFCDWWRIAFVSPFALYSPLSGEFAANIFFYIRKDIRHSVRAALDSLHQLTHPGLTAGMTLIKRSYWWQGCDVSKWTNVAKPVKRLKITFILNRCLNDCLLQANDLVIFTLISSVRSIRHAKGRTFCLHSLTDGLGSRMLSQ